MATSAVLLQYCFCTFSWRSLTIAMGVGRGSMGARSLGVHLQTWMRMCFSHHRQLIDKSFQNSQVTREFLDVVLFALSHQAWGHPARSR
jgi:hypothetical protein